MMLRAPLLLLLLLVPAAAQDPPPAPARGRLALGEPPAGWRARAAAGASGATPFLADYDLPAPEGAEPARVLVLGGAPGFEPPPAAGQVREERRVAGLKVRLVDQPGTYLLDDGQARAGRLVAAHLAGSGASWTAWLIGPAEQVATHREAYLAWLGTLRVVEVGATDDVVRAVAAVHGAPAHGVPHPWALVGHRIGAHALRAHALPRGGLDVLVQGPPRGPHLAALDGLLVATGASPGKGNLAGVPGEAVLVSLRDRAGSRLFIYEVAPALEARLAAATPEDYPALATEVLHLRDAELFTVEVVTVR